MWNPMGWLKKVVTMKVLVGVLKQVFLWDPINGHKRQIGGVLFALVLLAQQLSGQITDPTWASWLAIGIQWGTWLGTTFFAVGWGHAATKRKNA